LCLGYGSDDVDHARSGLRTQHDAGFASHPGPGIGHMPCGAFVACTDISDFAAHINCVVKLHHRATKQAEDGVYAIGFQNAVNGFAAGDMIGHGVSLLTGSRAAGG